MQGTVSENSPNRCEPLFCHRTPSHYAQDIDFRPAPPSLSVLFARGGEARRTQFGWHCCARRRTDAPNHFAFDLRGRLTSTVQKPARNVRSRTRESSRPVVVRRFLCLPVTSFLAGIIPWIGSNRERMPDEAPPIGCETDMSWLTAIASTI